jgi:glycopeptide antibiotics resistance protein
VAQLTGLFGLYPCAWRTFEVDDLILNIGGLMAGFALMRRYARA